MTKENISIYFVKPKYEIGQVVWVPQINYPIDTKIIGYNIHTRPFRNTTIEQLEKGVVNKENPHNLVGKLKNYELESPVILRLRDSCEFTFLVKEDGFYTDEKKAREMSNFLKVDFDDKTWKLAIGDRDLGDSNSPYHIDNSGLPHGGRNTSEIRDILYYCKSQKGLIVHDRDFLRELFYNHEYLENINNQSPLGRILEELQVF